LSFTSATKLPAADDASRSGMSNGLMLLFATAVGIVVLGLYASQPLVGLIGPSLGLDPRETGLVTTLTLLGYASGLFLLVPLTDLFESRALIVSTLVADVLALAAVASAPTVPLFLFACFVSGATASAIQMLVPSAALLSPEAQRGRVVGNVMSGLMLGILLSRPAASVVAEIAGWRWFYGILAMLVTAITILLARVVPKRRPSGATSYARLIGSLYTILKQERVLRRRAAYQSLCMGAFGIFWTAIALRLSQAPFSLGQTGIALFALAGAAGAVIAPIAGRAGDNGRTRSSTLLAHMGVIVAMILAAIGGTSQLQSLVSPSIALGLLVAAAVLLDLGVIADQTLGRRAINLLRPEARGRLNGLFTGLFFLGAAAGSGLSGIAWVQGGWSAVCVVGAAFGLAALSLSATERPET